MIFSDQESVEANSAENSEQMPGQPLKASDILTRTSSYFKKDLLWKPLVRRFRRYLKKEALPAESYAWIFSKPIA